MASRWPMVPLSELLTKSDEWVTLEPGQRYREVTVRMWGKGVVLRREVSGAEIAGSRRLVVHAGQFILSRIDARHGAMGLVPQSLEGAVVSNDFPAFTVNAQRILPTYLAWFARSGPFVELCRAASEGTTNRVRLKEERFLTTRIPLPPLGEQRRIVARVEELTGRIEEAQRLRRETMASVGRLAPSFVSQALGSKPVRGRLGDVLLGRPRNGWSARCDGAETGTPVLSLAAVTGFHYRGTEFKRTSRPTSPSAHYWLQPGDLLITRSNTPDLVGHAALYDGSPSPCIYPDLMMRLPIDETRADTRFVHAWLQSDCVRDYIRHMAKGTSPSMKKISQQVVMAIPFPSGLALAEQRRIVARVHELEAKVDVLRRLQSEAAAELDALMPAVLERAFRGEL